MGRIHDYLEAAGHGDDEQGPLFRPIRNNRTGRPTVAVAQPRTPVDSQGIAAMTASGSKGDAMRGWSTPLRLDRIRRRI